MKDKTIDSIAQAYEDQKEFEKLYVFLRSEVIEDVCRSNVAKNSATIEHKYGVHPCSRANEIISYLQDLIELRKLAREGDFRTIQLKYHK